MSERLEDRGDRPVAWDARERRFLIHYRSAFSLTLDCFPPGWRRR